VDVKRLYDSLNRDPDDYPLFEQIWQVLTFAPSCRHADEEELVSLTVDAFDYLQTRASGRPHPPRARRSSASTAGGWRWRRTTGQDYHYQNVFTIGET